jgi:hypothetical protein
VPWKKTQLLVVRPEWPVLLGRVTARGCDATEVAPAGRVPAATNWGPRAGINGAAAWLKYLVRPRPADAGWPEGSSGSFVAHKNSWNTFVPGAGLGILLCEVRGALRILSSIFCATGLPLGSGQECDAQNTLPTRNGHLPESCGFLRRVPAISIFAGRSSWREKGPDILTWSAASRVHVGGGFFALLTMRSPQGETGNGRDVRAHVTSWKTRDGGWAVMTGLRES